MKFWREKGVNVCYVVMQQLHIGIVVNSFI